MNREDFKALENGLIYLDNSATTLKPKCVIEKMNEYYLNYTSNIHRGEYDNATKTNQEYDEVRTLVKNFINAKSEKEIVYTSGATAALNMAIFGFFKNVLKESDEVLVSNSEHASNILPWLVLQKEQKIKVDYIPLDDNYELTVDNIKKSITPKTKVISIAHMSNVIGDIRNIEEIGKICKENDIYLVIDASQSIAREKIDVEKCNISFLAFSAHKMCGPTGVGILYGKEELLDEMTPLMYGGGMNQEFSSDGEYTLKDSPTRFEAGTPPIAEVIGLGEAIKYIDGIGIEKIGEYERSLKTYLIKELEKLPNITIYNKNSKGGIVAFNIDNVFSQDVAIYLNHYNIAIRAGNHCAKVLKEDLKIKNTCRISIFFYNTKEEMDKVVEVLRNSKDIFKVVI